MSYSAGEALILTQLQAVSSFSSTNTSRGKWGLLNTGKSDHYGIIKPGAFEREQGAMSMNQTTWQTIIQIWQRYKDDGDSMTNLETHIWNILARFDQYRKAADTTGTIVDVFANRGGEMQEMWNKDGGLSWLKQEITITWLEQDNITYAE